MIGKYIGDGSEVKNKGEYSFYYRSDKTLGVIYSCPECGEVSAGTDKHQFNISTNSVKPSIVHKCGYHGYLTNGEFTGVKE